MNFLISEVKQSEFDVDSLKMDKSIIRNQGKFVIEPLPRGMGQTLGNALRRVVLSSIKGFAVTQVRIDKVYHEFTQIPGVKEDTSEILFNLRKVRAILLNDSERQTIMINVHGERIVTAADFIPNSEVELIDPDKTYICELTAPDSEITMEVTITSGTGYKSSSELKQRMKDVPIGVLTVDAHYTPVEKVAIMVDSIRVGSDTDRERLTIEIETNGIKSPGKVLSEGSYMLNSLFKWIGETQVRSEEEALRNQQEAEELEVNLSKTIEELNLSKRAYNCLHSANINSVRQLIKYSPEELKGLKNFGDKSLGEIMDKLFEMSLVLRED